MTAWQGKAACNRAALASEVSASQGPDNLAMHPRHPLDAVVHRDPYPYYATLTAGPPLRYNAALNLWVAARASAVAEIFGHPDCRVRPAAEPIPAALAGSVAGDVFGRLVRMNDGPEQHQGKGVLERALMRVAPSRIDACTWRIAESSVPVPGDTDALNRWVFEVPVSVVATLLGFQADSVGGMSGLIGKFVACLSPLSTPAQLVQASHAATALQDGLASMLGSSLDRDCLLHHVREEARAAHSLDERAMLANLVGLLSQASEATAGLLANCLVALASHGGLLQQVREHENGWTQLAAETSRHDPPVQNTRRFTGRPVRIAGVDVPAGSALLLVLAAANRDPALNERPDDFLLDRVDRRLFTFSRGTHVCPGQTIATRIVSVALRCLFDRHGEAYLRNLAWRYRPSVNGRLPEFHRACPT